MLFPALTGEVLWSYPGDHDDERDRGEPFYSGTCGSCQHLPNGDALITESRSGPAFEALPDRTIVWEYRSPCRAGEDDRLVATRFELVRLPPDFPTEWLK